MSFFHKKNVTKCLGHHYAIKDIVEGLKGASIRKLTEEEKDNLKGGNWEL
jgi:hypothetical protein